ITDYDIKNLTKNTTYYFKIRVYDNSNLFNDSNEVDAKTLENLLPVVKLSASKNSAYVGEKIKFSSSGSYDPDGKIISYVWNFGIDEYTTSKGEDIEYIYTYSGNYNVTLKVIDDDYDSSIAKTEIEIKDKENIPPIADAGNDLKGIVGEEVYFNGKGYDPDGKIIEYSWDFDGDGIYDFKSDIGDAKYIYEIAGEYTAILKVLDDRGATGIDSCKVSITMKNRPPIPIITKPVDGSRFIFGEVIKFDGSLSYDEDGDKISYKWYSDKDGIIGKTNAFETILSIGLHTITLEVSDGKEKNSATIKITVLEKPNKAPLIKITSPINGSKVSGNVMVFGSASDDKKVSKVEIRIDNGDWVRAEGEKSWYYIWNTKNVEEGAHYIYAKATDSDGEETTTYIVVSLAKKKKEEKIFIPGFYAILLIFSIICVKFLRRTWN
ncbi:MAG: PKD domain-containing protein, partial [Candidatus Thermoplasmatota archaeon]